ncbi:MAG: ParB/RepB/Spo0J family partition protein [Candidatus Saccharibacteria bacterium]|nr:ParB/RepB/Spo0J family partition protein [Candidatus Saccharibacteria bacterium]
MKKGLGRGFEALIPTNLIDETFDPTAAQDGQLSQLKLLPLAQLMPDPEQPRRVFDEEALEELAVSIREHGVVQPLVVTARGDGYMIVAGERRWRAAKLAGLTEVPALVRTLSGQHRLEISLIENLQRRDLNPLETATAYTKLRDQFNLTLEEIGQRVGGKSTSAISNTMRLLKLPKPVQELIFNDQLSEGLARPLIGLDDEVATELAERAVREGWSVRRMEQMLVLMKQARTRCSERPVEESPHAEAAERLSNRLKTKISIQTNTRGAGKIIIPFKNGLDFERIQSLLNR